MIYITQQEKGNKGVENNAFSFLLFGQLEATEKQRAIQKQLSLLGLTELRENIEDKCMTSKGTNVQQYNIILLAGRMI